MPTNFGPFDTGNPAGYIKQLIQEGYRPTEGLRIFKEAGGQINEGRWFATYGQVNDMLLRQPDALALNPNQIPDAGDLGVWAAGRGNQYATQVSVVVMDRDTGTFLTKQHTYLTNEPHTPAEAETDALDTFGDPEAESAYGETVMGAITTNVMQTVAYGSGA